MSNSDRPHGSASLGDRARGWWPRGRNTSDGEESAFSTYFEPVAIIVIGMALALYDQTASEVSGTLRVPALLAGLILVGQGINDFRAAYAEQQARRDGEPVPEYATSGAPPTQQLRTADAPQVNRGVDPDAADDNGPGSLPWLVIALAVWLGLATLAYPTAPPMLIVLSLLAAFLLFSKGWGLVSAERQHKKVAPPA